MRHIKAPCSTCDGTIVAQAFYTLEAWCRCRRRWTRRGMWGWRR